MEKKSVLFVCYGLGVGGIEKCFVNLLNCMPDRYDIDVLLMNPQYTFKSQIKRNVHFINTFDYVMNIEDTISEIKKRGGFIKNIGMIVSYMLFRLRIKFRGKPWMGFKRLPEKYDIAISYSHHDFSPYYVIDKVNAIKKVLWYHNGAYEKTGNSYKRDKKYYSAFDKVVAVSTDCKKVLEDKFDFRKNQLIVLKNICNYSNIIEMAAMEKTESFKSDCLHIVTVGRMTTEKGALLAVDACKRLCECGYNIQWHWVGDGNQVEIIESKINEVGIVEYFILEGNQDNPYPFIANADIYVQPSFYEAYSTTITEAKVLKKPIVTTDVGGMRDQLIQGKNGIIVPVDAEAIADAIKKLIEDEDLRNHFCIELENEKFDPINSLIEYEEYLFL